MLVLLAAGMLSSRGRERPYDPDFDVRIPTPAYGRDGPLVLYDEGHANTHTADGGYKPLVDLLRNDGYTLRVNRDRFSPEALAGVSILLVVLPRGSNDANDQPAFDAEETDLVERWVREGGSLLLITDHWPYGAAAASLAQRFGIEMGGGLVEDPQHHDAERGDSHLVFSAENGLLGSHAILEGRNASERIGRILTFTGQSLAGPREATPLLSLSDEAVELPPGKPEVVRDGGDVRVSMEYGEPVTARGRTQGLALELERGRIVVLGEAGMLRAEHSGKPPVGMNVDGFDNRQLAINIVHWLSRVL